MAKTTSVNTQLDKLRRGIKNVKTAKIKSVPKKNTLIQEQENISLSKIDYKAMIESYEKELNDLKRESYRHEEAVNYLDNAIRNLEDIICNLQDLINELDAK